MDYEKKYEKLVDAVKVLRDNNPSDEGIQNWVNDNVPELKESDDESIRKGIIDFLWKEKIFLQEAHSSVENNPKYRFIMDAIAWLEKQGDIDRRIQEEIEKQTKQQWKAEKQDEQNPTNKVEPKFKAGDWIVQQGVGVFKIIEICKFGYEVIDCMNNRYSIPFLLENECHLWILNDSKPGDVLAFDNGTIVIFKDLYNSRTFHSYCHIEDGIFDVNKEELPDWWKGEGFKPATKEQSDILFTKMKEAGYMWDSEKKELKKIHVIDEGKAEMDYCFTKMMNGEKVSSAWSEEDIKAFNRISAILVDASEVKNWWKEYRLIEREEMIMLTDWLKSLKDRAQPQWKPSDEHISRLETAINYLDSIGAESSKIVLTNLLEQLKKL